MALRIRWRRFVRNHYNWSTIRMLKVRNHHGMWIVYIIPLVFSFLQEIKPLYNDFVQHVVIAISYPCEKQATINMPENPTALNSHIAELWFMRWENSMRLLFFSSLAIGVAQLFHRLEPDIIREGKRKDVGLAKRLKINGLSDEQLDIFYKSAITEIKKYEDYFQLEWDNWADYVDNSNRTVMMKTIENGALAEYDVESARNSMLLVIVSILYLCGGIMAIILMFRRSLIVLRGAGLW